MVAVFRNDSFGLTAKVRESGELFDVVVVDVLSGEEVLSTHRVGPEEAEKFALLRTIAAPSACVPGCRGRRFNPWFGPVDRPWVPPAEVLFKTSLPRPCKVGSATRRILAALDEPGRVDGAARGMTGSKGVNDLPDPLPPAGARTFEREIVQAPICLNKDLGVTGGGSEQLGAGGALEQQ